MWVWTPHELQDSVFFPAASEHRCPVSTASAIRRRKNSYDAGVAMALVICAIPIDNSNQQELQVICRMISTDPASGIRFARMTDTKRLRSRKSHTALYV